MISARRQSIILLGAAFFSLHCNLLLARRIDDGHNNPIEQTKPHAGEKYHENEKADAKTLKKVKTEKKRKEKEWRNKKLTDADTMDIAAHALLGLGTGGIIGSTAYVAAEITCTAMNAAAIEVACTTATAAATEAIREVAPSAVLAATKAIGGIAAKAATATGATMSAPWLIGGGLAAGFGIGFYWGWNNWKSDPQEETK